jgi:hypothetical protein
VRRFLALFVSFITVLILASTAVGAVTGQEWNWIVTAGDLEQAGRVDEAMPYWSKLVASLQTHDYAACGNYAKKLALALDDQGRYEDALAAYDAQIDCWGRLDGADYVEALLPVRRRAEQLRPEIRAFVSRPTDTAHRPPLAKNEPAFGTLLGGTTDLDPAVAGDWSKVAPAYGKGYALALVYVQWGSYTRNLATRSVWDKSSAMQVAWEPTPGLSVVQDNDYVRAFARDLKQYGRPVYLRFASEMNGNWTPWHSDPATYRAKFALVARVMREEAPNVAMVWSPNYVGDDYPVDAYYPGDESVDWVGINAYQEPYFTGNPAALQKDADIFYQGKRTNPLDKLRAIYDTYSVRKPIMISETGFGWANRNPYVEESQWAAGALERYYGYLPLIFPRIKAVSYFNVDFFKNPRVSSTSHYVLSGSPALAAAYKRMTASDWYLSDVSATSPLFWRPMEQATLLGQTRVAAYVNLGDRGVSRVEYQVDGATRARATQIPWVADLDLSGLSAGAHSITVKAYDAQGVMRYQRDYAFDTSAIKVKLNGRYLDFDQPPVMLNDRVLVPVRAILEALGAQIAWDGDTQIVTAVKDGAVLKLQLDNPVPLKNGQPLKALDVPAKLIGGRTLVPARFVSENYNMKVEWDEASQTVIITPKE